ncbi:hypothetical protein BH23PLA1_BH23PLA1_11310 [soil metagenome]
MKGPRRRRRGRGRAIGLLLVPPLFWAALLILLPTEWARSRVAESIQKATRSPVRLDSLRFGALGGVWLYGLEVGDPVARAGPAPGSSWGPWLQARAVRIDLNLARLLVGRPEPSRVEVRGLQLRLHRRSDGYCDFSHLLCKSPEPEEGEDTAGASSKEPEPGPIRFALKHARIDLLDEPTGTRLIFDEIEGQGSWSRELLDLEALRGKVNGGDFGLVLELSRDDVPAFDGQFRAEGLLLDDGMGLLRYLLPYIPAGSTSLQGKLDLVLYLRGRGATLHEVKRSLVGQGSISVNPIRLDESPLLADLAEILPLPEQGRIGSIGSSFAIGRRQIVSQHLALEIGRVPIVLSGGTSFKGDLDYRLDCEEIAQKLSPEARGLLNQIGIHSQDLISLRIDGTLDDPQVTFEGSPLLDGQVHPTSRLDEVTRRLRDQIRR